MTIKYSDIRSCNYKYRLVESYEGETLVNPPELVSVSNFVSLSPTGHIVISSRYEWDGPSGPTIDTSGFMRGSLVHDALYQLMREGKLSDSFRKDADVTLRKICREDGMSAFRAAYVYAAVRMFASSNAKKESPPRVLTAP